VLSALAAVLAAATSLAGLFWTGAYARETKAWWVQAVGQDAANLPVVAVTLGCAALLRRRGSLAALCVWLGCLLYFIYAFVIYAFAVHFTALFLAYVAVLGLSFHAVVATLAGLDVTAVTAPLRDRPGTKAASPLLIAIGLVFATLWLIEDTPHVLANTPPPSLAETALWTNPVHVLDLAFVLPAMIVTGVQLRRGRPWALLLAPVLLVFAVAMGVAILALFALSAFHGFPVAAPAAVVVDVIVVVSAVVARRLLSARATPRSAR
jgi:hypothetical protein